MQERVCGERGLLRHLACLSMIVADGTLHSPIFVKQIMPQAIFSRRNILNLATGICLTGPLGAYAADPARFWEKEDPASWSAQETEQFVTNSPWAKPVDLQLPNAGPGATNNR